MSLTSYRAAPSRAKKADIVMKGMSVLKERSVSIAKSVTTGLYRPGDDLLSRALRRSTIGPGRLNDRVRNGIGWGPSGIATRSIKPSCNREDIVAQCVRLVCNAFCRGTIKPIGLLVPVSFTPHGASTPGLSTW